MTPRRRNEQSRRAILDAALALLAETGYATLTIEAIAARAGVGKQTIYRWWRGKGAIILDALTDGPPAEIALPDTGDLRADLRTTMRATVAEFADPRLSATTRALTIETLSDEVFADQVRERLLQPQLDAIRRRLDAARRDGVIDPVADLEHAVELLVGPVFHRWLLRTGPLTETYADTVVDRALRALRAEPPG